MGAFACFAVELRQRTPRDAPVRSCASSRRVVVIFDLALSTAQKQTPIENPDSISSGDSAIVVFSSQHAIYVEPYQVCGPLGRISCLVSNEIAMVGVVLQTLPNAGAATPVASLASSSMKSSKYFKK